MKKDKKDRKDRKDNVVNKCIKEIFIVALLVLIVVISYFYVAIRNENESLSKELLKDKIKLNIQADNALVSVYDALYKNIEEETTVVRIEVAIEAMEYSDYPMKVDLMDMLNNVKHLEEINVKHPEVIDGTHLYDISQELRDLAVSLRFFFRYGFDEYHYDKENMTYKKLKAEYDEIRPEVETYIQNINHIYDVAMKELEIKNYEE